MTTTPPSYTSRDDDDDDEDDQKSCFKSAKNRVCYSLSHMYTYIGKGNCHQSDQIFYLQNLK